MGWDPRSRRTAILLTSLVALGPLSTDLYLPSLPAMVDVFGTDVARVQLTLSVFLVGFALSQLAYGPLSDRFGRRPVLLGGLAIYCIASLACAFATTIGGLIAARFLQALGGCCGPVIARAIVRDVHGLQRAARTLAYIGAATALAPAIGPIIGGYLEVAFGWRSSFFALTLFGLVVLLASVATLSETNEHRNPDATRPLTLLANYRAVLRHDAFIGYTLCVAFCYSSLFAFISGSSFVLIEVLHVAPNRFGYCFAVVVAGYLSGTLSAGRLTMRLGIDRMISIGTLLSALSGTVMAALALCGVYTLSAVLVPTFFCMLAAGLVLPNAMAGATAPFPRMAGSASALMGFVQMGWAAFLGYLVGYLHDGTPAPMANAIGAAGWGAFASYRIVVRRTQSVA
ncbi:MAG: multidrug effflux MFS transporter [Betaproteobacteria bacterium]